MDEPGGLRQLAQYTSEFQAREAGRANAQRFEADLIIHQASGPSMHLTFDVTTGTLSAATDRLPSD